MDFYCAEAYLIVEVDGEIHDYRPDEDALRQAYLESLGLRVLRFRNEEVLSQIEGVLAHIEQTVRSHPPTPPAGTSVGRSPLHREGEQNVWNVKFAREFDMTNDRHLFTTSPDVGAQSASYLPLYEGKMIHQYNAFYEKPQFWVDEDAGGEHLKGKTGLTYQRTRLAFRDVTNATNERTLISAIIPPKVFAGNTAIVEVEISDKEMLFLLALLNSFCIDWITRFKVDKHVNFFIINQLPVPRLTPGSPYFDAIVPRAARLTCTRPEFADLWQAVMGTEWGDPVVDPAERQRLRNEIDAIVAHLYGLSRDEFDHILGTFPLVFPDTDAGRERRAALLLAYDEWEGKFPA